MSVLLISAQAVKDRSRIVEAVDADVLRPTIDTAQRVHLLPILGAGLYDYLIANYSSLDSDHTTLLQTYIWPALVHFVVLEAANRPLAASRTCFSPSTWTAATKMVQWRVQWLIPS